MAEETKAPAPEPVMPWQENYQLKPSQTAASLADTLSKGVNSVVEAVKGMKMPWDMDWKEKAVPKPSKAAPAPVDEPKGKVIDSSKLSVAEQKMRLDAAIEPTSREANDKFNAENIRLIQQELSKPGLSAEKRKQYVQALGDTMLEKGNIDLTKRPVVKNKDGSISTVRSMGINDNGVEVLIPTVIGNRVVSDKEAIDHYRRTGEHLGKFSSVAASNKYAQQLHKDQEKMYAR